MRVVIGGVGFEIRWVRDADAVEHQSNLWGQVCYGTHSIKIHADPPVERRERALLHELVHGVVSSYRIRELYDGESQIEAAVVQLAVGLCEALNSLGIHLPVEEELPFTDKPKEE